MLHMTLPVPLRVLEIDLEPLPTEFVERRADRQEDGVLRCPHDLQVEFLVQFVEPEAFRQTRLGPRQHVAQPREILLGRTLRRQFRGLDLVDLAHLDRFVDLPVLQRQTGAGQEGHRLEPALVLVDVDAGLGPAFDHVQRFQDRQRLAHLSAADGKMLGQVALRRSLAAIGLRRGQNMGRDGG